MDLQNPREDCFSILRKGGDKGFTCNGTTNKDCNGCRFYKSKGAYERENLKLYGNVNGERRVNVTSAKEANKPAGKNTKYY